jgi:DNA polymerase III epsilon subunit-like protein
MRVLLFDTETTGLPHKPQFPAKMCKNNWADIVSIAWILADENGNALETEYHVIRPDGWSIPQDSVEIHKITEEYAYACGESLGSVIIKFIECVRRSDVVVAHNINFDKNVINNALRWRMNLPYLLEDVATRLFCTMKESREIIGLPGKTKGTYKMAKLSEMYSRLFDKEPTEVLHNALGDTQIMKDCFFRIWGNPLDLPEEPVFNTNEETAKPPITEAV